MTTQGRLRALHVALGLLGAVGCGGSNDAPPDGARVIDAAPPDAFLADADPAGPFRCVGAPLPTTAIDPIGLSGFSFTIESFTPTVVPGVQIDAFKNAEVAPVSSMLSDGGGRFLIGFSSNGLPVEGYLRGTKAGFLPTFLYPPAPLSASTANVATVMATTRLVNDTLGALLGETQDFNNALVLVVVTDCDQQPVKGAVVTSSAGGVVHYNAGGTDSQQGVPSSRATVTDVDGIAYVFNVPPGDTTVDASVGGQSLREHVIVGRSNALTSTLIIP